jgi:ABC-type sugar transport system substrate-binding protein
MRMRGVRKRFSIRPAGVIAVVLLLMLAIGASSVAADNARTTTASRIKPRTIGIYASQGVAEIQKRCVVATKAAVKALGWKFRFVDGEGDPSKMQQRFQALVNSRVDAIVGCFLEPAPINAQLQAAKKAGIPVVNAGLAGTPSPLVAADYQVNDTKLTQTLVDYMGKQLPKGAKIGVIALPQFIQAKIRVDVFKQAAKKYGWQIVAEHNVNLLDIFGDTTKGGRDILTSNPDLDAFFGCCDFTAIALSTAVEGAGKRVPIYTFYAIPSTVPLVRAGKVVVVEQDSVKSPLMAIDQLAAYFERGSKLDARKALRADPFKYRVITKDNAPANAQEEAFSPVFPLKQAMKPYLAKWRKLYGVKA